MNIPIIEAAEAADFIKNGHTLAVSGFAEPGSPKVVTSELAKKAEEEHQKGHEFKVNLYTGASTNDTIDGELSRARAIGKRVPYQGSRYSRNAINEGEIDFIDPHLSDLSSNVRNGLMGEIDVAIIEVTDYDDSGSLILGTGIGNAPAFATHAKKVILEHNTFYGEKLRGLHDIYTPGPLGACKEIPIYKVSDRIGEISVKINPENIVGVVKTNSPEKVNDFTELSDTTAKMGDITADFLVSEIRKGTLPKEFLPVQSGVGNISNAVLHGLAENPGIPEFEMYTEVFQDTALDLIETGKCRFASSSVLLLSDPRMLHFLNNIEAYRNKIILRPAEISNHPEVIRRLGLISINTALECDIYGNVNSTHVNGTHIMNGIGGAADFARNAYLSIFICPSTQKGGRISTILPMVTHVDSSEHSVKVIITEQGYADLRNLSPMERARAIIENCAHPDYREILWDYLKYARKGHLPHNLRKAFSMHAAYEDFGDMRLTDFSRNN